MKKYLPLIFILTSNFIFNKSYAQVPVISYHTPLQYHTGITITPLTPINTGGAVPATIYGQTTTLAGSGNHDLIDGTGTDASFFAPLGVSVDPAGNVYVADTYNYVIRKITPAGVVTTVAGMIGEGGVSYKGSENSSVLLKSGFFNPKGVAFGTGFEGSTNYPGSYIYVADSQNNLIRKIFLGIPRQVSPYVSTLAGSTIPRYSDYMNPTGIVCDNDQNVYFTDNNNNRVMKINQSKKLISTLAGNKISGSTNGSAESARFYGPSGIAIDKKKNIYIADTYNNLIRKIDPQGIVTTLAGSGIAGSTDANALNASFNYPTGVTVDDAGNVYVGDHNNNVIRKIDPQGIVTTLAGKAGITGSANGTGAAAAFNIPTSLAVDKTGAIYVADAGNSLIRKIITTGYTISPALPAGLVFDGKTGTISGTPTSLSAATNYTITAYNTAGISTAVINIIVDTNSTFTYGMADFDPYPNTRGITYTSSNPAVCTVINNKIHIAGAGTSNITGTIGGIATTQAILVKPALLTVTANDKIKVYNYANAPLTVSYSGFVNNETAANLSVQPVISTTAVTSSAVGRYPITVGGATSSNYIFTYIPGTLTVTSGSATLTPIPVKTYGDPDFSVYGSIEPGVTYTSSNPAVATIIAGNIHITGAGTTTITISNGLHSLNKILTVNKAPLTITADNQEMVNGFAKPELKISYSDFVNGETPADLATLPVANCTVTPSSAAGTYPITVSGAVSNNYAFTYVPGNMAINSLSSVVTPLPEKTYGDDNFAVFGVDKPGINYTSSNPSVANIIQGLIEITGAGTTTINASNGTNSINKILTVKKASLVITADNQTKTAGSANPILTVSYSGFVNNEDISQLTTLPVLTTTATTASPPGTYPITMTGATADNYEITYVFGTLTVTRQIVNSFRTNAILADNIRNTTNAELIPTVKAAVSPNGDGINDVLTIDNIANYPDNKLMLMNSSGAKIFEVSGYDNVNRKFDGRSNITGALQQSGTYFYLLQYSTNGSMKSKTGYFILKR